MNPLVGVGLWLIAALFFGWLAGRQIVRAKSELDALGEATKDFKRELKRHYTHKFAELSDAADRLEAIRKRIGK